MVDVGMDGEKNGRKSFLIHLSSKDEITSMV